MTNNNALVKHDGTCGLACLGPLSFHPGAVGKKITLSHGNCRASRELETFKNGLVFSSRPLKIKEKVQFRVERCLQAWTGAARVGFTNVCPTTVPLPPMAVPNLTDKPVYAALSVPHDEHCPPGTTVSFWMDPDGQLHCKTSTRTYKYTQTDLDLSQPLWAFIDVYGQTTTVLLLGSVRRTRLFIKTSCPISESTFECGYENTPPELQKKLEQCLTLKDRSNINNPQTTAPSQQDLCVVCRDREACLAPRCGHHCLCLPCANRVFTEFGTCPLCRESI